VGLLTPHEVIEQTLHCFKKDDIPMSSCEGFIRQMIGWREFVRGIYQNYSEKQDQSNFWKHERKLKDCWYQGNTGIAPLDDVIKKTLRYGYAHHIERLMVVGSLMLLLEVHPQEAHKWFMEMFVDSSDWVMGPNVFGMALFSDGGIFATKPYFCGSNYYRKMGASKEGDWQEGVDGLYWSFIEKHKTFFLKNPRLSMMARTVEKMSPEKKQKIYAAAKVLKQRLTK
jgi:deoxyribodipyrimidine photolyase-related protein